MGQGIQEWTKYNLWKTAFLKIWNDMVCLSRMPWPFLNALTHMYFSGGDLEFRQGKYKFQKWEDSQNIALEENTMSWFTYQIFLKKASLNLLKIRQ